VATTVQLFLAFLVTTIIVVVVIRRNGRKWPSLRFSPKKVPIVGLVLNKEEKNRQVALEYAMAKRNGAAATANRSQKVSGRCTRLMGLLSPIVIALGILAPRFSHGAVVAAVASAILVAIGTAVSRNQRAQRICRQAAEKIGSRIWQARAASITIEQLLAGVTEDTPNQPLVQAPIATVNPAVITLQEYIEERVDKQIKYLSDKVRDLGRVSTRAWWWNLALGVLKTTLPLVGSGGWMGVIGASEVNTTEDESRISLTLRTLAVLESVKLRAELGTIELPEAVKLVEEALLLNVGAWFKAEPPASSPPAEKKD
jgi:hypothetical protein